MNLTNFFYFCYASVLFDYVVSTLRIDKDKNQFQFSRPLSENVTLDITYNG